MSRNVIHQPQTNEEYYYNIYCLMCSVPPPTTMAQQPPVCQGLLIVEVSRSYSDTSHSVGRLWMSDQSDAETSTW